ncbi:MAG TPA: DUF4861 domain-containing protein [Saprospiraceae bacterium]|nr:DUF4861 domain-containing protein [Saprospiraceae bacterium]
MKKQITFSIFITMLLLTACQERTTQQIIKLTNPSDFDRVDEPIVLARNIFTIKDIPNKNCIVLDKDQRAIPFQLDDLDEDGQWDEMFLLVDLKKKEQIDIIVMWTDQMSNKQFRQRANVRFANKAGDKILNDVNRLRSTDTKLSQAEFQMEGPAWENDVVAFRNYFDARNGIDIYGKRTKEMILHKVGINGQNYHQLDDWGMDILKVGTSLGAGAIAISSGDTLYRVDLPETSTYHLLVNGPLRSVFDLKHHNFKIGDHQLNINHRISIWGGAACYKSSVTIDGLQGNDALVTGIVNLHSDTYIEEKADQYLILATHDIQAEDQAALGMALLAKSKDVIDVSEAPKEGSGIVSTYLLKLKAENNKPTNFYFYAGWATQDKGYTDKSYFMKRLKKDAMRWSRPIIIK